MTDIKYVLKIYQINESINLRDLKSGKSPYLTSSVACMFYSLIINPFLEINK